MTLVKYQKKRKFRSTSEPRGIGKKTNGELHFVVQKHAASHLHYDFRLELDGVLKSWAVPKGPSLNPDEKRLAMEVEDHPYEYKDFEGTIPKGNYGAGKVIIWDEGTYESANGEKKQQALRKSEEEKKLLAGLHKGHISFTLHGKKLAGEYALVKLKGNPQKNSWLLIKKKDKYASKEDILKRDKSVISGVTIDEIGETAGNNDSKDTAEENGKDLKQKSAPVLYSWQKSISMNPSHFMPMHAFTTPKPFDDKNWIFEIKYDGYRAIALIDGKKKVDLFSRNRISFNSRFKVIAEELKKIDFPAVLDGEIVVEDEQGRTGFQLLQNYIRTGIGNLKYYVFDILNLEGRDLHNITLLQRKELLKLLLSKYRFSNVFYADHIEERGNEFYALAVKNKLEGIIAKRAASPYRFGRRSRDWLKIKITNVEEAVIAGFTEGAGSREFFGSLLLGQYDEGILKYIGNCGTGFSENLLKELHAKFRPFFTEKSSFKKTIKGFGKIQWIEPKFVCQVKFTEKTQEGILRHPVFLGLRIDKDAHDVIQENQVLKNHLSPEKTGHVRDGKKLNGKAKNKEGAAMEEQVETISVAKDYDLKVGKVTLHLTNQHKIFFPEDKITKGDMVKYYAEMADVILPYLKDRPQSMLRFPNGIHSPGFFHKDVDRAKIPSWLKTQRIYSEHNDKYIDYLICNDKATLIYMANLGCIDLNPWNSTIKNSENPDWAVIDLDPENIDFKAVVKTALVVKKLMDELNTPCYCKTSGATGLHIFIPLAGRYNYDVVKNFAQLIAHHVHARIPEITSIERLPKNRQHKVYIDFLQNRRGQTLAAPYSVRPKEGAPVSTPLLWNEVTEKLSPLNFTMKNIFKRLEKKGDLWKPVIGKGVNIEKLINELGKK